MMAKDGVRTAQLSGKTILAETPCGLRVIG